MTEEVVQSLAELSKDQLISILSSIVEKHGVQILEEAKTAAMLSSAAGSAANEAVPVPVTMNNSTATPVDMKNINKKNKKNQAKENPLERKQKKSFDMSQ